MKCIEVAQTSTVVDHVKEMTSKRTYKYVEYGSFEQLLFFFFFFFFDVIKNAKKVRNILHEIY